MKNKILISLSVCALGAALTGTAPAQTQHGSFTEMPAYYDGKLFTINFTELPSGGESANLKRNSSINTIYQSDPGLPDGQPFVSVLDAIQGDGFNPLWEEVQITFTAGHTPQQFFSDNEVLAAAASGEITLTKTGELYTCAVVGPK
jgi:hypothetical protein